MLLTPAGLGGIRIARQAGPYLFVLDLQGTPLDEFPSAVKALNGVMTVVNRNGQHMLRASSPSEFLITLPQVLPPDFTVEVDLIPKSCCNPDDLMVEGTPTMNRGPASAQLTWHPAHISVVGGGEMYQSDMPADLAASTPGNLTNIVMTFSGSTVKLYTNGRRLYTVDRQFPRGRVLRVWLGGQDDRLNAVYLAGLRVGTGAVAPGIIAAGAGLPGGAGVVPNPRSPAPANVVPVPLVPWSPLPGTPPATSTTLPVLPMRAATHAGPIATPGSGFKAAARCRPSGTPGAPPLNYQVGGGRIGGATLAWWIEANAEYLLERSPDAGNASRTWTRLTSSCDVPSGMTSYMILWEDGNTYPVVSMADLYPGLQLDAPYLYKLTIIRPDGTSGWTEAPYRTSGGVFMQGPIAAVNGHTVRVAADISCCVTPPMRCDPWMLDVLVTSSSTGYQYSSRQPWSDSYDPTLPLTVPGGVEGAYVFVIPGVPSGTHTFAVTAVYQPNFRIAAGSVTVQVP
jgi:hypothetical protein